MEYSKKPGVADLSSMAPKELLVREASVPYSLPAASLHPRADAIGAAKLGPAEDGATEADDDFHLAPLPYLLLSQHGTIVVANSAAHEEFIVSEEALAGRSLEQFVAPADRPQLNVTLATVTMSGRRRSLVLRLRDAQGGLFPGRLMIGPDRAAHLLRVLVVRGDGSGAHATPSCEQFRAMADAAPVLIWMTDDGGQCVWVNRRWLDLTGRPLAAELGQGWTSGVHPDDLQTCLDMLHDAIAGQRPFTMEYRLRDRFGVYRHLLVNGAPRLDDDGRLAGYVGSCTDISAQRKNEEALRHSRQMLRHLVEYQERVREDERKRIAREIHDDLGQNLLALRLEAVMLQKRAGGTHPRLHARVSAALEQIDATMKAVRAAINNLRPTALDLGLNAAIEWQVQEFQRRSGIDCRLVLEEDVAVDETRATALFRILQESLNNVQRHAQADKVAVSLRHQGDMLRMEIADDGIGLYPDCRRKANSFGLIGIEERIHALGGALEIRSDQQQGTTLVISIPLR